MFRYIPLLMTLSLAFILLYTGCSGNNNPIDPDMVKPTDKMADSSRVLWGYWNVEVIPDNQGSAEFNFTPMRMSLFHLNVLGIMQNLPGPSVGIEPPAVFANNVIDVDIRLTHPFSDLDKFTGFDVRGILIGHGSFAGFSESLLYHGPNDLRLLNADGYSRLWNPTDYTGSGYVDGDLGTPDALANFSATLNAYKYFADDLTSDMAISDMLKINRGAFTSGSSNVRHYSIKLGDKGLTFQYAIDANWFPPVEPYDVPDSFDIERANCPEPYHMDVHIGHGIHGGGGSAPVTVNVYDWQGDCDMVYMEAPMLTEGVIELTNSVYNGDFVTYTGDLNNDYTMEVDSVSILIYATGVDPGSLTKYADYQLYTYPIVRVPEGGVVITIQDEMAYKTIGVEYSFGGADYDYGAGDPAPVSYTDPDGPWDFTPVPVINTGTREAISPSDPEVAAFKNEFNGNVTHFFRTMLPLDDTTQEIYQAESHNEGAELLRLWGIYTSEPLIEDVQALPLDPPIDFPYPMDINTDFTETETYTIIPFLLTLKIIWNGTAVAEGIGYVPVEPGVNGWGWESQPVLQTRTVASFETGGLLGQGPMGSALMYEWIADDGTGYGSLLVGNSPDSDPGYDDDTYEILGTGVLSVLRAID